tara:strand:- start:305 stop:562 length:258 start_codon:yes stop_codon:yes gene_type:complete
MYKLIFGTPSFDLMKDVYKRFGVEFHPNTPITKIGEKLKEMGYGKTITQASTTIRQVNRNGKDFVNKVEEATREEKKHSLETTQD